MNIKQAAKSSSII